MNVEKAGGLGIRWTIGDVSAAGFEALRLSIHGAFNLFGRGARYAVCVNSIGERNARERTGSVPRGVEWLSVEREIPRVLRPHMDERMAQGAGWKFVPLRVFPDCPEIALDNDVILWSLPKTIHAWLQSGGGRSLIAADVIRACGQFSDLCPPEPLNSGIRGLPSGYDYAAALAEVLRRKPVRLVSELDEQGLQIAAVSLRRPPLVVSTDEVSICSPFPYHQHTLGCCGAHFVGINMRKVPTESGGESVLHARADHWRKWRAEVIERVGADLRKRAIA